jgi:predicted DNA-binding transcriptional regulator AlpA
MTPPFPANTALPAETSQNRRPFTEAADELRMLTFKEVQQIVRYARATIYRKIHEGEFPPGIKLGPHRRVWQLRDIENWIASRIAAGSGFKQQSGE